MGVGRTVTFQGETPMEKNDSQSFSGFCSLDDPLIKSMLRPAPKARRSVAGPLRTDARQSVPANMFSIRQPSPPNKLRLKPRSSSSISKSTAASSNVSDMPSSQVLAQLTSTSENAQQ